MEKGNCSSCGLKIQKTTFDKCMYCGALLNEEQTFTEEEKSEIVREKKELEEALEKQSKARSKKSKKRRWDLGTSNTNIHIDIDFDD